MEKTEKLNIKIENETSDEEMRKEDSDSDTELTVEGKKKKCLIELKEGLKEFDLSGDKWANILYEIGVHKKAGLRSLNPTIYKKCIRKKNFITSQYEKEEVKKLFNVSKLEKTEENKEDMQRIKNELAELKISEEKREEILEKIRAKIKAPSDFGTAQDRSRIYNYWENFLKPEAISMQTYDVLPENEIVTQYDSILKGVFLTKNDIKSMVADRSILTSIKSSIALKRSSKPTLFDEQECKSETEHQVYEAVIKKFGESAGVSAGAPIYGVSVSASVSQSYDTENEQKKTDKTSNTFMSKYKYAFKPMKEFTFSPEQLGLSTAAFEEVRNIDYLINTDNLEQAKDKIKKFFIKFGSHAQLGSFQLGGTFILNASLRTSSTYSSSEISQAVSFKLNSEISASGFGYSVGVSAGISNSDATNNINVNTNLTSSCNSKVEQKGGQKTGSFKEWLETLEKANSTWDVISYGNELEPVWKIISRKYSRQLKRPKEIIDKFIEVFCEVTGCKKSEIENSFGSEFYNSYTTDIIITLSEVNKESDDNLKEKFESVINQLKKTKSNLTIFTKNPNVWSNFLTENSVIDFLYRTKDIIDLNSEKFTKLKLTTVDVFGFLPQSYPIELEFGVKNWLFKKDQIDDFECKTLIDSTRTMNSLQNFAEVSQQVISELDKLTNEKDQRQFDKLMVQYEKVILNYNTFLVDLQTIHSRAASVVFRLLVSKYLSFNLIGMKFDRMIEGQKIFKLLGVLTEHTRELNKVVKDTQSKTEVNKTTIYAFTIYVALKEGIFKQSFNWIESTFKSFEEFKVLPFQIQNLADDFLEAKIKNVIYNKGSFENIEQSEEQYEAMNSLLKVIIPNEEIKENLNAKTPLEIAAFNMFKIQKKFDLEINMRIRQSRIKNKLLSLEDLPFEFHKQLLLKNPECFKWDIDKKEDIMEQDDFADDFAEESSVDNRPVNVCDVLTLLFTASDLRSREVYVNNLLNCNKAIPFILPFNNVSVWPLLKVTKTYLCFEKSPVRVNIFDHPCPKIGVLKLGKPKFGANLTKSKLLNSLFFEGEEVFISDITTSDQKEKQYSFGQVDLAWYCPEDKTAKKNMFENIVTVFNLRGDALLNESKQTLELLREVCDMLIVIPENTEAMSKMQLTDKDVFTVILTDKKVEGYSGPHKAIKTDSKTEDILNKLETMCVFQLSNKSKGISGEKISFKPLYEVTEIAEKRGFHIDLDEPVIKSNFSYAKEILDLLNKCPDNQKFILQSGDYWGKYVENVKKTNRLNSETESDKSRLLKNLIIENINTIQKMRKACLNLSPYMYRFLEQYLSLDKTNFIYFLESLEYLINRQMNLNNQDELDNAYQIIHILREVVLIFECYMLDCEVQAVKSPSLVEKFKLLSHKAAEAFIEGFTFELMDGDKSFIPVSWTTHLFESINRVTTKSLVVTSIVGLQSSGKSTMLNVMFNMKFPVAAKRCTKGLNMRIQTIEDSDKLLLVLDTEGLRAPELRGTSAHSFQHDNEMATIIMGLSDFSMINLKELNNEALNDIIDIVIHSFIKFSIIKDINPLCVFVHQDVSALINADEENKEAIQKVTSHFDNTAKNLSQFYNLKELKFEDIVHFTGKKNYYIDKLFKKANYNSSISQKYINSLQDVKDQIFQTINNRKNTAQAIGYRVKDLWEAVLKENFVFAFKNTQEYNANIMFEKEYSKILLESISNISQYFSEISARIRTNSKGFDYNMCITNINVKEIDLLVLFRKKLSEFVTKNSKDNNYIAKYEQGFIYSLESNIKKQFLQRKEGLSYIYYEVKVHSDISDMFFDLEKKVFVKASEYISKEIAQKKKIEESKNQIGEVNQITLENSKNKNRVDLSDSEIEQKFESEFWADFSQNELQRFLKKVERTEYPEKDSIDSISGIFSSKDGQNLNFLLQKNWPHSQVVNAYFVNLKEIKTFISIPFFSKTNVNNSWEAIYQKVLRFHEKVLQHLEEMNISLLNEKIYDDSTYKKHIHNLYKWISAEDCEIDSATMTEKYKLFAIAYFCTSANEFYNRLVENKLFELDPINIINRNLKPKLIKKFKLSWKGLDDTIVNASLLADTISKRIQGAFKTSYCKERIYNGILSSTKFHKSKRTLIKEVYNWILIEKNWEAAKLALDSLDIVSAAYVKSIIKTKINEESMKQDLRYLMGEIYKTAINKVELMKTNPDIVCVEAALKYISASLNSEDSPYKIYLSEDDFKLFDNNVELKLECTLPEFVKKIVADLRSLQILDTDPNCKKCTDIPFEVEDNISSDFLSVILGCQAACPFCGQTCDELTSNHQGDHTVKFHKIIGLKGDSYEKTGLLINNYNCNTIVDGRWLCDEYPNLNNGTWFKYSEYRNFFANWNIPFEPNMNKADFWVWFIKQFDHNIQRYFDPHLIRKTGGMVRGWNVGLHSQNLDQLELLAKTCVDKYEQA